MAPNTEKNNPIWHSNYLSKIIIIINELINYVSNYKKYKRFPKINKRKSILKKNRI